MNRIQANLDLMMALTNLTVDVNQDFSNQTGPKTEKESEESEQRPTKPTADLQIITFKYT